MRSTLRRLMPILVVAAEGYFYWRYSTLDALFHYWLHFLAGATIALFALTLWGVVRRRPPGGAWGAGFVGHIYSATPDVLFLAAGVLHVAWMDVFALHITIHFIPAPLAVLFVVFAVTLGSWAAATLGRRTFAVGGLVVVLAVFIAALSLADEPPASLQDLRRDPRLAFVRPLAGSETTVAASSRVTSAFVAPLDVAPTAGWRPRRCVNYAL